jgi:serine kinase of HPr protein (carbohydrate metabolism regulator)
LKDARELVHGTCVALGRRAALLRGGSGAGKSDFALRFIALPGEGALFPRLVADDQVLITANADGTLFASPPPTIAGKIEVRGLGIVDMPYLAEAELVLVCDLVEAKDVPRMPAATKATASIAGVAVACLKLAPFEASAPLKLKMALLRAAPDNAN